MMVLLKPVRFCQNLFAESHDTGPDWARKKNCCDPKMVGRMTRASDLPEDVKQQIWRQKVCESTLSV
jgi:hypothetical protein